jgi:hypothetical protein
LCLFHAGAPVEEDRPAGLGVDEGLLVIVSATLA